LGRAGRSVFEQGAQSPLPGDGLLLLLRAISTPVLTLALYLTAKPWARDFHVGQIYYFGFFATYLACTVLLFFICIEVFRSALAAFPGIAKLAIVIFPLGGSGFDDCELDLDHLRAQGNFHHRGHLLRADALGQRSGTLLARFSLPEHECAAPDGARFVFWHCFGLWCHVLGGLYSRVVDLSRCIDHRSSIPSNSFTNR
jgi:hypothetical protein